MRFALKHLWRALLLGLALALTLPGCSAGKTTGDTPAGKEKEAGKEKVTEKEKATEKEKEKGKDVGNPPPHDPG
jgi:hypothetical protein